MSAPRRKQSEIGQTSSLTIMHCIRTFGITVTSSSVSHSVHVAGRDQGLPKPSQPKLAQPYTLLLCMSLNRFMTGAGLPSAKPVPAGHKANFNLADPVLSATSLCSSLTRLMVVGTLCADST
jgi:hypothetical protein